MVTFTTSWDDGHPLDLRVAEVLARHGFRGTFYVPLRNVEGRGVMTRAELRELGAQFDVGAHTVAHRRLPRLASHVIDYEVHRSKQELEEVLGRPIHGFCYPGGAVTTAVSRVIREAGFHYARTTENFRIDRPANPWRMPTTLQLYPHTRFTYLKNLVKLRSFDQRAEIFATVARAGSLQGALRATLELALRRRDATFHLWGHSWEIEAEGLWGELEAFLEFAASRIAPDARVDNTSIHAA